MRVAIEMRLGAVFRYAAWEWLMPLTLSLIFGAPILGALALICLETPRIGLDAFPIASVIFFVALVLLSAPIALFARLCSRRRLEVWISSAGLWKRYPNRDIFFAWSKFVWILERGGDTWLVSFSDGCFIPRESFNSREESREFVRIVREIKRTRGSVWRDKWNGRVFGLQDDDDFNNPR